MAVTRLSFEERKTILKWYFKCENAVEVQRQWRREFGTRPPSRLTIARIRDKFEADGTVCDVHKGRSGRPRTATSPAFSDMVLQQFDRSPHKSATQCARETGVSSTSIRRILKTAKWKVKVSSVLIEEDEPTTIDGRQEDGSSKRDSNDSADCNNDLHNPPPPTLSARVPDAARPYSMKPPGMSYRTSEHRLTKRFQRPQHKESPPIPQQVTVEDDDDFYQNNPSKREPKEEIFDDAQPATTEMTNFESY